MKPEFQTYWSLALASVHRQLVAAGSACADRDLGGSPLNLSDIRERLRPVRPIVSVHVAKVSADLESGHKIQVADKQFQESLRWLQKEICELLGSVRLHANNPDHAEVIKVLRFSAETTAQHFGTITEGWDRLVDLKRQLLLPNDAVVAKSAWLVSLMADFERSLRDAICLPIQCLGRLELVKVATAATIAECRIPLCFDTLLRHERTDDAAAQAISGFMADGVERTVQTVVSFGRHLGVNSIEGDCFHRGFYDELDELGTSGDEIISTLIALRRAVLHDTSFINVRSAAALHASVFSNLGVLAAWQSDKLRVVAQFLYSYSILYTLGVMDVISRESKMIGQKKKKDRCLAATARYKAASELRVGTLGLLKKRLWWLAWSVADYVRDQYDDHDGLMLRLNAAYAQSQLDMPKNWRTEAVSIGVEGKAPRYLLLKKCILGEWHRITSAILDALRSGDMTREELATWPALEPLRGRAEYNKALADFERL